GNDRMVDMLLVAGADPEIVDRTGKAPVVYAAGKGYTGILARLLDAGVKVDARYSHDLSALMWAAGHSNDVPVGEGLSTVKLLIDRGAQLDLVDDRGRSALMNAAQRDHGEIAALLIERGADATLEDRQGMTALELAGSETLRQTLQALLEKKTNSNQ
ncbi:MAG: ankyrin repeat domain-containing protein, partial [Gammaproteobacteria bacterium]|nr:ankyrin repeat domain-containing protein [Gammaproteobacteria bacterium]